jgi:hypothetical protein
VCKELQRTLVGRSAIWRYFLKVEKLPLVIAEPVPDMLEGGTATTHGSPMTSIRLEFDALRVGMRRYHEYLAPVLSSSFGSPTEAQAEELVVNFVSRWLSLHRVSNPQIPVSVQSMLLSPLWWWRTMPPALPACVHERVASDYFRMQLEASNPLQAECAVTIRGTSTWGWLTAFTLFASELTPP